MSNQPSKHHYVPICYLKSFTNLQGVFWKRQLESVKTVLKNPSQVCYQKDFYKINDDDTLTIHGISDRYIIEKEGFRIIENNYRKILNTIVKYSPNPRVVDKLNYKVFLEFLVTQKRRNPFTKNFLTRSISEHLQLELKREDLRKYLKKMSKEVGDDTDIDEYLETYTNQKIKNPGKLTDLYLSGFLSAEDSISNSVSQDLYRYKQFILFTPIGCEFITSDNPGFTKVGDNVMVFGGFGDAFCFYFPLSPTCCLLIDSSQNEDKSIIEKTVYPVIISISQVAEVNRYTKETATKDIFGYSKSFLERI